MKQILTVEDVLKSPLNTLKEKQIRNKLRDLKTIYPKLIRGGNGYGRSYKYTFPNYLLDLVTERKYKTQDPTYTQTRRNQTMSQCELKRKEMMFFETNWMYFTGLTPTKDLDPSILKETINDPNLKIFYSIHRNYDTNSNDIDTNHIHWVFEIINERFNLKEYNRRLNNTDYLSKPLEPQPFDQLRKQECFEYLIGEWYETNRKQTVMEYGTL